MTQMSPIRRMDTENVYTMEYYSATKNEDIMNFSGKWMELENIILSEATQTQKGLAWYVLTNKWILAKIKSTEYPQYSPQNSKRSTS
jgi:hypothetical protein